MERCFYVDTPVGKLRILSKHSVDNAEDYPGVFIDIVNDESDYYGELLCCVEYDPIINKVQTVTYKPYQEEPVSVIEQTVLPARFNRLFDSIVNKYNAEPDHVGDIYSDFASALRETGVGDKGTLWSDGEMLLTPSCDIANIVADWLDSISGCACTGYYDAQWDKQHGIEDGYSGNWYIDI